MGTFCVPKVRPSVMKMKRAIYELIQFEPRAKIPHLLYTGLRKPGSSESKLPSSGARRQITPLWRSRENRSMYQFVVLSALVEIAKIDFLSLRCRFAQTVYGILDLEAERIST